jgi:hypothetical protein
MTMPPDAPPDVLPDAPPEEVLGLPPVEGIVSHPARASADINEMRVISLIFMTDIDWLSCRSGKNSGADQQGGYMQYFRRGQ